ncbi:MAG: hypothetical protein F4X30_04755 [Acidimicrobiaceae bacterium]|nr:hypothetical protein [Acidimicrobiaceae bacterium]
MTNSRANLRRRLDLAALALLVAASLLAAYAPGASALQVEEDRTSPSVVDAFGVDLISHTAATTSSPAVIRFRIAAELSTGSLRARLHAPVTTRDEMLAIPSTPLITEWDIEDARTVSTDDQGVVVSVPVQPPGEDLAGLLSRDARPLPLHLEMTDAAGSVVARLTTFLTRGADVAVSEPARPLTVAVILDLRLPPSHLADGGAAVDPASLHRALRIAEVLTERSDVPLSVVISPETLDALALIGDDTSVEMLRSGLQGRQLLATTWTSIDIADWMREGRADVVGDGLERSTEALRWAGLEASTVMYSELPLAAEAVTAITGPESHIAAFASGAAPFDGPAPFDSGPRPPVTSVTDAAGRGHPLVQSDSLLSAVLRFPDAERGLQSARAELLRMAVADRTTAVVVSVSAFAEPSLDWLWFDTSSGPTALPVAGIEPAALASLLDMIAGDPALRPATVNDVLAQEPPVGAVTVALGDRSGDPRDFDLYLARRIQVERRLEAYESFRGDDPFLVAPLRTLLAVSASRLLTTGERTGFLEAVDQQVAQGTTGVEFLPRGPITVTGRRAELPVTLVNSRPSETMVAVELTAHRLRATGGERFVFTLHPGRNDLAVPVVSTSPGSTLVTVLVTTPDEAGAIALTTGTFSVRFADAEGVGLLILVLAAIVLAAWWLQTLRKRARDAGSGGATVASPGPVSDNAEASSSPGTPSTGDHTRT